MPIYKLKGNTYDIPEDKIKDFEKDYPDAAIPYSIGDDEYEIPISKRDRFLEDYPEAIRSDKKEPEPPKVQPYNGDFTITESQLKAMENEPQQSVITNQGEGSTIGEASPEQTGANEPMATPPAQQPTVQAGKVENVVKTETKDGVRLRYYEENGKRIYHPDDVKAWQKKTNPNEHINRNEDIYSEQLPMGVTRWQWVEQYNDEQRAAERKRMQEQAKMQGAATGVTSGTMSIEGMDVARSAGEWEGAVGRRQKTASQNAFRSSGGTKAQEAKTAQVKAQQEAVDAIPSAYDSLRQLEQAGVDANTSLQYNPETGKFENMASMVGVEVEDETGKKTIVDEEGNTFKDTQDANGNVITAQAQKEAYDYAKAQENIRNARFSRAIQEQEEYRSTHDAPQVAPQMPFREEYDTDEEFRKAQDEYVQAKAWWDELYGNQGIPERITATFTDDSGATRTIYTEREDIYLKRVQDYIDRMRQYYERKIEEEGEPPITNIANGYLYSMYGYMPQQEKTYTARKEYAKWAEEMQEKFPQLLGTSAWDAFDIAANPLLRLGRAEAELIANAAEAVAGKNIVSENLHEMVDRSKVRDERRIITNKAAELWDEHGGIVTASVIPGGLGMIIITGAGEQAYQARVNGSSALGATVAGISNGLIWTMASKIVGTPLTNRIFNKIGQVQATRAMEYVQKVLGGGDKKAAANLQKAMGKFISITDKAGKTLQMALTKETKAKLMQIAAGTFHSTLDMATASALCQFICLYDGEDIWKTDENGNIVEAKGLSKLTESGKNALVGLKEGAIDGALFGLFFGAFGHGKQMWRDYKSLKGMTRFTPEEVDIISKGEVKGYNPETDIILGESNTAGVVLIVGKSSKEGFVKCMLSNGQYVDVPEASFRLIKKMSKESFNELLDNAVQEYYNGDLQAEPDAPESDLVKSKYKYMEALNQLNEVDDWTEEEKAALRGDYKAIGQAIIDGKFEERHASVVEAYQQAMREYDERLYGAKRGVQEATQAYRNEVNALGYEEKNGKQSGYIVECEITKGVREGETPKRGYVLTGEYENADGGVMVLEAETGRRIMMKGEDIRVGNVRRIDRLIEERRAELERAEAAKIDGDVTSYLTEGAREFPIMIDGETRYAKFVGWDAEGRAVLRMPNGQQFAESREDIQTQYRDAVKYYAKTFTREDGKLKVTAFDNSEMEGMAEGVVAGDGRSEQPIVIGGGRTEEAQPIEVNGQPTAESRGTIFSEAYRANIPYGDYESGESYEASVNGVPVTIDIVGARNENGEKSYTVEIKDADMRTMETREMTEGELSSLLHPEERREAVRDVMPMREENGKMKPDWDKAEPKRARDYIYNERGLSEEEADAMVANNLAQAQRDLESIGKRQPKMGTDIDEYQEAKVAWQAEMDAAQRRVDYWKQVQQEQVNEKAAAAKETFVQSVEAQRANELRDRYQARFEQARTSEEKASVIEEYLGEISEGTPFKAVAEANLMDELRAAGVGEKWIAEMEEQYAQGKFYEGVYFDGKVYINADRMTDIGHAENKFVHERQHLRNRLEENSVYLQQVKDAASREELAGVIENICGNDFYNNKSHDTLADEFIAFTAEIAHRATTDEALEQELASLGVNKNLTDIVKRVHNEQQRNNEHLPDSGRDAYVNRWDNESRNRQDERNPSARPERELGREGTQSAEASAEGTGDEEVESPEDRQLKSEIEAVAPGSHMEGVEQPKMSVSALGHAAGLTTYEEIEGSRVPFVDGKGNVIYKLNTRDGKEEVFSVDRPITIEDLKRAENSAWKWMLEDAMHFGVIDQAKADAILGKLASMINAQLYEGSAERGGAKHLGEMWQWVGETVFKTIGKNSDAQYNTSIDITRLCKKNEQMIYAISEKQRRQGYGITPAQILDLYQAIEEDGFQVPCPVCYVFSRYINNGKYASTAINGMLKYGDHMPNGKDPWTVEQWEKELSKQEKIKKRTEGAGKNAREDLNTIPDMIDLLREELRKSDLTKKRQKEINKQIKDLDKRYRKALDAYSQINLSGWIKAFAIGSEGKQLYIRKDAKVPTTEEEWQDFRDHALDIRLTASAYRNHPGIQRLRKSGGSAGGKEITFASDNYVGEVALGIGRESEGKFNNKYEQAAKATTEEERAKFREAAREEFKKSLIIAGRQTLRGGQRMWSWSDNIERLSQDVAQNLIQMEVVNGAVQSYSKQLEGINMVARMGAYVNGSLIARGKGVQEVAEADTEIVNGVRVTKNDITARSKGRRGKMEDRVFAKAGSPVYEQDGKFYTAIFDDVVGVDPFSHDENGEHHAGLFELNDTLDKAGNIIVGMNDLHIRTCLADDRIFFCIPWHSSGLSNHLLAEMMNILGVKFDEMDGTDYTDMQEERMIKDGQVIDELTDLWEASKNERDWQSGIGEIKSGDGKNLSEGQKEYRRLRKAIFDGTIRNNEADLEKVQNDAFLSQVLDMIEKTVPADEKGVRKMTATDDEYIYPYEYWDTNSTYDTADINGARYLEYCRRLGRRPKFSGRWEAADLKDPARHNEGNFTKDRGYWKLLIDRRMYGVDKQYQGLTPINSDGFDVKYTDENWTKEHFRVTEVADNEKTAEIVSKVDAREAERFGDNPTTDMNANKLEPALKAHQKAIAETATTYKDVARMLAEKKKAKEQPMFSVGENKKPEEEQTKVIFDAAKKKFGRTYDIREAGYVLPDGVMLDFSGRHELFGADDSFLRGSRTTDHRQIKDIAYEYDAEGNETETGIATDMPDFIERGAIRIDDNAGTINLIVKPTREQRDVLRRLISRNDGDVTVDFGNGWDTDTSAEYYGGKAQRILGDIDRYFDEGIKPVGNEPRFSVGEEKAYKEAVDKGDTEAAQRMVKEAAKKAMPDTKVVDEDGNPLVVYHGTDWNPMEEATGKAVFDDSYRGTASGDNGFFGRGFYFTFGNGKLSRAEAGYYGSNVGEYYLNITNPFMFHESLGYFNGTDPIGDEKNSVMIINMVEKFPEFAKNYKLPVYDVESLVYKEDISLDEYTKRFMDVYNNKEFIVHENADPRDSNIIEVCADPVVHKDRYPNGEEYEWTAYGFRMQMYKPRESEDAQLAYTHYYLTQNSYRLSEDGRKEWIETDSGIFHELFESEEFTEELKMRGHDGVMQSAHGDEVVAFYPNQIKSADPITYDGNGELIPLSDRFNTERDDIRFSVGSNGKSKRNEALYHGKPFWIGSVNLLDGEIEEVHTFEEAQAEDFHHSFVFSPTQVDKIDDEENAVFWLDNGKIVGTWRTDVPFDIKRRIKEQISLKNGNEIRFSVGAEKRESARDILDKWENQDGSEEYPYMYNSDLVEMVDNNRELTKDDKVALMVYRYNELMKEDFEEGRRDFSGGEADDLVENQLIPYLEELASDDGGQPMFSVGAEKPTFYSNAERAVEDIKQEKATPEQWLAMITKNGGLKAGEDKWMGLSDWLKSQDKKSLTKQEVMDFIRGNRVEVEDVNYEMASKESQEKLESFNNEFKKYVEQAKAQNEEDVAEWAFDRMVDDYGDDFRSAFEIQGLPNRQYELIPQFDIYDENVTPAAQYYLGGGNPINGTRLRYTTEGLEDKREIALVVPSIESWNESDDIHFGDAGEGRAIAWIRFGETEDAEGNRVLVIDEIQSKRHQEGREKGYLTDEVKQRLQDEYDKAKREFYAFEQSMADKYGGRVNGHRTWVLWMNEEEKAEYKRLEGIKTQAQIANNHPTNTYVPEAPFDKNWHELAMKRMLRYAAENGYDKIAWTKGEQQADRYNITKIVSHVKRNDTQKSKQMGVRAFEVVVNGETQKVFVNEDGTIRTTTFFMDDMSGKPLSELFGKELAIAMMEMEDGQSANTGDMKVGGDGMKGFYDQIIPRFMDKYGKRWGVKTQEIELPNVEEAGRTMWSVDVTPEMKESVMQGQPMFSVGSRVEPRDVHEVAAEVMSEGRMLWDNAERNGATLKGVKAETGYGEGEKKRLFGLFRSAEKGGKSVDEIAHEVMELCEDLNIPCAGTDEAKAAILDVLSESEKMSDIRNYARNRRLAEADERTRNEMEQEQAHRDQHYMDEYGMTEEEYQDYLHRSTEEMMSGSEADQEEIANLRTEKERLEARLAKQKEQENELGSPLVAFLNDQIQGFKSEIERIKEENSTKLGDKQATIDDLRRRVQQLKEVRARRDELKKKLRNVKRETSEELENKQRIIERLEALEEELNNKNSLLSQRVLDTEMKNLEFANVKEELVSFIEKQYNASWMPYLGKDGLNSLLNSVKNAKTMSDLEEAQVRVRDIAANGAVRYMQDKIGKLLKLPKQGKNTRGMVIGRGVDERTRRIFDNLFKSTQDLSITGMEEEMDALRKEQRSLREDMKYLERQREEADEVDAIAIDEEIRAKKAEQEALSERMREKKSEIEEARYAKESNAASDVESEIQAVYDKLAEAAEGRDKWTDRDTDHLIELEVKKLFADAMKSGKEAYDLQKEIAETERIIKENNKQAIVDGTLRTDEYRASRNKLIGENKERRQLIASAKMAQAEKLAEMEKRLSELYEGGHQSLRYQVQREIERKHNLLRNAYDDIRGKKYDTKLNMIDGKSKKVDENSDTMSQILSPLYSFEYMCKSIVRNGRGEDSFLYNYFIKGDTGAVAAYNNKLAGIREQKKTMNDKVREIFGIKNSAIGADNEFIGVGAWARLAERSDKVYDRTGIYVEKDGEEFELPMSKGQAMYVYMVWKMADGRVKLENQGFSDTSIEQVRDFLGNDYLQLADWIQEDFLTATREKYNERYIEMYHTSMDKIENYVPLKINKAEVTEKNDMEGQKGNAQNTNLDRKAGSLIQRTKNVSSVDISRSAFDVISEHIEDMEDWYAYVRVRRDLDTLLNSRHFRNQLNTNKPGSFKYFKDAAMVGTESEDIQKPSDIESALSNATKNIVGTNIAFRVNTAFKQFLSAPAYLAYSNNPKFLAYLAKNAATSAVGANLKWCYENLETFRNRVKMGDLGDNRLSEELRASGDNWAKTWEKFSKVLQSANKYGMIPNRLVDAITCSMGIKTIYEYEMNKANNYVKKARLQGAEKEAYLKDARERALREADIFYNATQQSSVPAFLSKAQRGRGLLERGFTAYQNSNLAYTRMMMTGLKDLRNDVKFQKAISEYTERFKEEGMSEVKAKQEARILAIKNFYADLQHIAVPILLKYWWAMGSSGLLGFFTSDDDDEEESGALSKAGKYMQKIAMPFQGLPMANILNDFGGAFEKGWDYRGNYIFSLAELTGLANDIIAANERYGLVSPQVAGNVLYRLSRFAGVDIQTIANICIGVEGLVNDGHDYEDWMVDAMYILNTPKSGRKEAARTISNGSSYAARLMQKEAKDFQEYAARIELADGYLRRHPELAKWMPWMRGMDKYGNIPDKEVKQIIEEWRKANPETKRSDEPAPTKEKSGDDVKEKLEMLKSDTEKYQEEIMKQYLEETKPYYDEWQRLESEWKGDSAMEYKTKHPEVEQYEYLNAVKKKIDAAKSSARRGETTPEEAAKDIKNELGKIKI